MQIRDVKIQVCINLLKNEKRIAHLKEYFDKTLHKVGKIVIFND